MVRDRAEDSTIYYTSWSMGLSAHSRKLPWEICWKCCVLMGGFKEAKTPSPLRLGRGPFVFYQYVFEWWWGEGNITCYDFVGHWELFGWAYVTLPANERKLVFQLVRRLFMLSMIQRKSETFGYPFTIGKPKYFPKLSLALIIRMSTSSWLDTIFGEDNFLFSEVNILAGIMAKRG